MRILVGCEESQAVTIAFRKLGHEAFSCDLEDCSGGHPEWHLQMDIKEDEPYFKRKVCNRCKKYNSIKDGLCNSCIDLMIQ